LRKRKYTKGVSALATFLGSGLLHEYVLALIAMKGATTDNPYIPRFGAHVAFFVWNGVVLCLEHLLGNTKEIALVSQVLPKPVRTAFVLLTVLPISHWFTDEYISNGMLPDFAMSFPQIVRLND
jgi:hypothetical protein